MYESPGRCGRGFLFPARGCRFRRRKLRNLFHLGRLSLRDNIAEENAWLNEESADTPGAQGKR
jgi:hypothetical protein